METIAKTDMQVDIERLDENNEKGNYRIVWGNPLNSKIEGEVFATWIKINDYAFSINGVFSIGEYKKDIEIQKSNTGVNIVLE